MVQASGRSEGLSSGSSATTAAGLAALQDRGRGTVCAAAAKCSGPTDRLGDGALAELLRNPGSCCRDGLDGSARGWLWPRAAGRARVSPISGVYRGKEACCVYFYEVCILFGRRAAEPCGLPSLSLFLCRPAGKGVHKVSAEILPSDRTNIGNEHVCDDF